MILVVVGGGLWGKLDIAALARLHNPLWPRPVLCGSAWHLALQKQLKSWGSVWTGRVTCLKQNAGSQRDWLSHIWECLSSNTDPDCVWMDLLLYLHLTIVPWQSWILVCLLNKSQLQPSAQRPPVAPCSTQRKPSILAMALQAQSFFIRLLPVPFLHLSPATPPLSSTCLTQAS